jgi:hypothetical protein
MMLHKLRIVLAAILVAAAAVSAVDSASAEIVTPANDPFFIDLESLWYP